MDIKDIPGCSYAIKIVSETIRESLMRGRYQHDDNDCGLACVFTVLKQLKIKVDERELRKNLYLGKEGLSLYGVTEILREKGITSSAIKCDVDELSQLYHTSKMPVIIMICENDELHYVVVYKLNSQKIYMWDPNKGKRTVKVKTFLSIWTGYAIKITKVARKKQEAVNKSSLCLNILKKQNKIMFLILLFAALLMFESVCITFAYKEAMDGIRYDEQDFVNVLRFLLYMGAGYLIMMITSFLKEGLMIYSDRKMEISFNHQFIDSLFGMSLQKKEDYASGGILDRYYRLSSIVKTFSTIFSSVLLEMLSLLAAVYIMLRIDAVMFAMVHMIVVSYIVCFLITKNKLLVLSKSVIDNQSILTTQIKETVQNLVSLKAFDSTFYQAKMKDEVKKLKRSESQMECLSTVTGIVLQAIENGTMLCVLGYGICSIVRGTMSLGTLLAFETFVGFFLSPIKNLLGVLPSVQEMVLTFNRIEDVLIFSESKDNNDTDSKINGEIVLENVDVAYGFDQPVLKNVSIKINNRDKVFLMGTSGSGKSTLAKTMAGFVRYDKGRILYDGKENRNPSGSILYLSQDAEIFSGTIQENILMWKDKFDGERLEEVLHNIGIYHFMEMRGFTLHSSLQENGTNLSGGEKQRIAIARALMSDMPIYIFDEATCHLDKESERQIIKYIKRRFNEKTCIFISHNEDLLEENDTMIFIDDDRKIHCKTYQEWLRI